MCTRAALYKGHGWLCLEDQYVLEVDVYRSFTSQSLVLGNMSTPLVQGGFGTPTAEDRRPWLWAASIMSCTYSILTLVARLTAKFELLAAEDAILGVAYVCISCT
jgi:hypothetical protein